MICLSQFWVADGCPHAGSIQPCLLPLDTMFVQNLDTYNGNIFLYIFYNGNGQKNSTEATEYDNCWNHYTKYLFIIIIQKYFYFKVEPIKFCTK